MYSKILFMVLKNLPFMPVTFYNKLHNKNNIIILKQLLYSFILNVTEQVKIQFEKQR